MKTNGRAPLLGVNDTMPHAKAARKRLKTTGRKRMLNGLLGRLWLYRDNIESECAGVRPVVVKCATALRLILLSPV